VLSDPVLVLKKGANARYQEIYQAITKDQGDQLGTTTAGERQFPRGETENEEIERHPVDEGGSENLVVREDNRASGIGPHRL